MNFMSLQVNHDNSHEKQTYITKTIKRDNELSQKIESCLLTL